MDESRLFELYEELQDYLEWSSEDVSHLAALKHVLAPAFPEVVDDFYAEIARHPAAAQVITGGNAQIARLKQTLLAWISDLFDGPFDAEFVGKRFKVGYRHVEIGLEPVYPQAAIARIRLSLTREARNRWTGDLEELEEMLCSLNRITDLEMTIINFAYQSEYTSREQRNARLATLGKVAAGIAHELRNPLNAVRTSVYYLLNAANPTDDKKREHLERIERQVGISDGVITALSRFAKLSPARMQPLNLCDFVHQALETNPLPDSVELELQCPESEAAPFVNGDQDQLVIVLGNLIRNACDAMPDGGRLTIHGRQQSHQSGPENLPTDQFALSITDTGGGIDPEIMEKIMEPLFSTKTRGLGLGLALAREIIQQHGGNLLVSSRPGQGTTFTILLNLVER